MDADRWYDPEDGIWDVCLIFHVILLQSLTRRNNYPESPIASSICLLLPPPPPSLTTEFYSASLSSIPGNLDFCFGSESMTT